MTRYEVANHAEMGMLARILTHNHMLTLHRSEVRIALCGGTSITTTLTALQKLPKAQLSRLQIFLFDERIIGEKNEDLVREYFTDDLIDASLLLPSQLHFPVQSDDTQEVIESYESVTRGAGTFDIALLGAGPDGHFGAIFPGYPHLHSEERTVSFNDSPKPPPHRMSCTLKTITNQTLVILLMHGAQKHEALTHYINDAAPETNPINVFKGRAHTYLIHDFP